MKFYEILSHTADLRIKATGTVMAELFAAGLEGVCHILKPGFDFTKEPDIYIEIEVSSFDISSLFVDFLAEALFIMHSEKLLLAAANMSFGGAKSLHAVCAGYKADMFDKDVKAITYHEAEIITNSSGLIECTIVPDI